MISFSGGPGGPGATGAPGEPGQPGKNSEMNSDSLKTQVLMLQSFALFMKLQELPNFIIKLTLTTFF